MQFCLIPNQAWGSSFPAHRGWAHITHVGVHGDMHCQGQVCRCPSCICVCGSNLPQVFSPSSYKEDELSPSCIIPHFGKCCFSHHEPLGITTHIRSCVNQRQEVSETGLRSCPLLYEPMHMSHPWFYRLVFYVNGCLAYMCVWAPWRGSQIPWDWNYRGLWGLWVNTWALRLQPWFSEEQSLLLTAEPFPQPRL